MTDTIHATAVSINGVGVLLIGPSGSGKSDLALRLIDRGATLIADDRVIARPEGEGLLLSPPPTIQGLIEVRGVGIIPMPHAHDVPAALVVELGTVAQRLPEPESRIVGNVALALIRLMPFEASAPIRIELAVAQCSKEV